MSINRTTEASVEATEPADQPDYSQPQQILETVIIDEVEKPSKSIARKIWDGWLKVAHAIGTVQMMIILTIIYWVMIPFIAIPFRMFSDPLMKKPGSGQWHHRDAPEDPLDSMSNQG